MSKKHLSKTKLSMYLRCPFQYYCRYIQGLKKPPSSAILMGKCFDTALNYDYGQKISTGVNEPSSVVKDCFAHTFESERGDTIFEKDENPDTMKDIGVKTVEHFQKNVASKVQPHNIQISDTLEFDNVDYALMVVVDLVTNDGIVVDNKFASRKWSEGNEMKQLDPVIYSLWYEIRNNKPEKTFRFDIGIGTKIPGHQQVERKINAEEKTGFLKLLACVNDNIQYDTERGIFYPRVDNMLCSRKYCGYWEICEREWKHKIK